MLLAGQEEEAATDPPKALFLDGVGCGHAGLEAESVFRPCSPTAVVPNSELESSRATGNGLETRGSHAAFLICGDAFLMLIVWLEEDGMVPYARPDFETDWGRGP